MIALSATAAAAFSLAPAPHPHLRANTAAYRACAPQLSGFESGFPEGFGSLEGVAAASASSEAGDFSVVSAALVLAVAVLAFNLATDFAEGVGTAIAEDDQQQQENDEEAAAMVGNGHLRFERRVVYGHQIAVETSCCMSGHAWSRRRADFIAC